LYQVPGGHPHRDRTGHDGRQSGSDTSAHRLP
jgi:hypothetical protein